MDLDRCCIEVEHDMGCLPQAFFLRVETHTTQVRDLALVFPTCTRSPHCARLWDDIRSSPSTPEPHSVRRKGVCRTSNNFFSDSPTNYRLRNSVCIDASANAMYLSTI
jgi:hypothetical protein